MEEELEVMPPSKEEPEAATTTLVASPSPSSMKHWRRCPTVKALLRIVRSFPTLLARLLHVPPSPSCCSMKCLARVFFRQEKIQILMHEKESRASRNKVQGGTMKNISVKDMSWSGLIPSALSNPH
ncbi:hypothetical protein C2845_PM07G28050 [Panicum miliaceum]|uniref:Uncharacterized protein n=1 Tax=Panicum miliaceum TaxID=4540 RepID=A0A3L6SMG6_PANMI|nr:hypothetical protein C2845_PM07G28050 [Panicum miliaceum]